MTIVRRSERGVSESLQWAVITPALLLCVLGLVQTGAWLHGRQVLHAAAAAAAEAEAVLDATPGSGERAARQVAGTTIVRLEVRVTRRSGEVSVTVSGDVPMFFDVGQGRLTATAAAPVEETTR